MDIKSKVDRPWWGIDVARILVAVPAVRARDDRETSHSTRQESVRKET
jgi:hypothetical protein